MTNSSMLKKLDRLEKAVIDLQVQVETQSAIEGIRRGLSSIDRGEGVSAKSALRSLERKHRIARP